MDKNAIKKYAIWARTELIARVAQKALQYGITDATSHEELDKNVDSVNGKLLTSAEKKQRADFIDQIKAKGFDQVIEEVAYTWFNRFTALRFMEVNGYLPTRVRVFTDEENNFKPQIITEAIHLEMDGLDIEKVYAFKEAHQDEELYKYLLITQCNALNKILPGMFQKLSDYTELLLPDNLLREGSVIEQMIALIPEEDWKDAVQIIGWLYQYYNSEPKDKVFANLKKNIKISKENIPAATQLFTPDWIVRYMVENSLGRLWLEGHPNDQLKAEWQYYLDEAEQEPEVMTQLEAIRKEYADLKPEDILCIDPCMGSGHILAYMFDVLVKIYEAYGHTTREAAASIVENNLWGLDIDDRAAQLAYFVVMMKARQYDRRFFSRAIQPRVYAICESNQISPFNLEYFVGGDEKLKEAMDSIIANLQDAKEYGSLVSVRPVDFDSLHTRFAEIEQDIHMSKEAALQELYPLVQTAQALAQKYDVVITNPPYMGSKGMSTKLADYVKKNYPESKSDMFAVFIEKCVTMTNTNRYKAMITQHSWMFLSSFEKLRSKLLSSDIINMAHLGARAFEEIGGEVVQTTSWVQRNSNLKEYSGTYARLVDFNSQELKEKAFLSGENNHVAKKDSFSKIPGAPIAYWVSESITKAYSNLCLNDRGQSRKGMATGLNEEFVRLWYELNLSSIGFVKTREKAAISNKKWFPYANGGGFRKWFGYYEDVVNWENDGYRLQNELHDSGTRLRAVNLNLNYIFKEGINWSSITSSDNSFRILPAGFLFSSASNAWFGNDINLLILGFLNSKVAKTLLKITNPTLNANPNDIGNLPLSQKMFEVPNIDYLVKSNISISKEDWDSFETSWDFTVHPLVEARDGNNMQSAFDKWSLACEERFYQLKANEEELNRIFIDIYGLQDELTPEVEEKDVTVRRADLTRDIKSFISYAVGCMFGRYSLDIEGLAYAGGDWDASKYVKFPADNDNIIPICDDEYFEDDILGRFMKFVEVVYGAESLDENLKFIAEALGGKGSPKEVIRKYFLNDFFADHCKVYQKRPIYWLFDSGKKNGFKALIYMHRYQPDTIARIRTDYVHEQQSRYRTAIADLEQRINGASTSDRVNLNKELIKLKDQEAEIRVYEEKIHHLADQMLSIDLDDGVKHNYDIFKDVLAKIK